MSGESDRSPPELPASPLLAAGRVDHLLVGREDRLHLELVLAAEDGEAHHRTARERRVAVLREREVAEVPPANDAPQSLLQDALDTGEVSAGLDDIGDLIATLRSNWRTAVVTEASKQGFTVPAWVEQVGARQ